MIYQEIRPDFRLQNYIACYWMVKSEPGDKADFRMIFPDGCTDIIFNFADPLISKSSNDLRINPLQSFIVGNMTQTVLSSTQNRCDLFGVRFKPGAMQHWIDVPISEFTDATADAEDYSVFRFWFERLSVYPLANQRSQYLNTLLLENFKAVSKTSVEFALAKLQRVNGMYRISALSKEIGISQKQLERNFKHYVGLTPKQFARVMQFQHMTSLLRVRGEDSLLQLAVDGGYTDHAHFTKSFREFSGITPQEYLRNH